MNMIELGNAISDAVNTLYQLGNELAAVMEGRIETPANKAIASARAVGIAQQTDSVAERVHQAFHAR